MPLNVALGHATEARYSLPAASVCWRGTLEFTFATVGLRGLCEGRRKALATMGVAAALSLSQRLADMAACDNVAEFVELFSEDVTAADTETYALRLDDGWTVTFKAAHLKLPTTQASELDWSRVRRIMILAVEQTHGWP